MRIVQFIALIFVFSGCLNEPDCIITSTNLVKIYFKKDSKTPWEITFSKINVSGLTKDFYAGQKVSFVELPVNPGDVESTFTFYFEKRVETIHLTYTKQTQVISASCGAFTNYSNLEVTDPYTTFELNNIKIINNQLLLNATSNLEIYLD